MDWEFASLALIGLITLGVCFAIYAVLAGFPAEFAVDDSYVESYWEGCDEDKPKTPSYLADCELRQKLIKASIWEDVNGES